MQSRGDSTLVRFGYLIAQDWTLRHGRSSRSSNYELGGISGCAGGLVLEPVEGRGEWEGGSTLRVNGGLRSKLPTWTGTLPFSQHDER